jgi:hypothetical protein
MEKFISNSINKTPPMLVQVIDLHGKVVDTYQAPSGFQLDRYVNSLFPQAELMVSACHTEINVSVIIPENKEIYQIHRGIYDKSIGLR